MDKLRAILDLFRKGNEVANPGAWKNPTILANLFLAIVSVVAVFGFKVELTADNATNIAAGVIAAAGLLNGVLATITSKRAGLPAASEAPTEPSKG